LRAVPDQAGHAIGQAIHEEAEVIFAKSQVLTPIDTGALRGSGAVTAPELVGTNEVHVDIYYGGTAAPYALLVHELNYQHNAPTQSKYLEEPFMERMSDVQQNIAKRVLELIRKESRP
jgi:hypothetical protein